MLIMLALQATTAAAPDIQLHATITADSVRIEKRGDARLEVHAEPDAGSLVKVEAPKANGAKTLRNVRVTVDAEARISGKAALSANGDASATDQTPPR